MQHFFYGATLFLLLFISSAHADKLIEISFNDLPEPIQQASKKYFNDENITKINYVLDHDVIHYTLSSNHNDQLKSVTFLTNGSVIHTEQTFINKPNHKCIVNKPVDEVNMPDFYVDVEGYERQRALTDCRPE
jgi:hypothetical protein